jgi:hypothetical protein
MDSGHTPAFSGLRELYVYMTGDKTVHGHFWARSQEAAMVGSDLPNLLQDTMYKRLMADYAAYPNDWRKWSTVTSIKSLEEQTVVQMDAYASLPSVAEGASYTQVSATDYKATYTPKKHGETVVVTREMILRDDTRALTRILPHLAKSAAFTLNDTLYGLVEDNGNIYDSAALFLSTSVRGPAGNIASGALASATLADAIMRLEKVRASKDNAGSPIAWRKMWLVVPPALALAAAMLCGDEYNAAGNRGDVPTSGYSYFSRRLLGYIVAPWNASASKWWLVGDPADCDGLEVGFLNGRDSPELFLMDDPRVGTVFTNDQISYKVRFEFGAGIVNWRPFVGYMT